MGLNKGYKAKILDSVEELPAANMAEIAEHVGCSYSHVRETLKLAGVRVKNFGQRSKLSVRIPEGFKCENCNHTGNLIRCD